MTGFYLLAVHIWGLSLLIFALHYYNPRFGFAPLMMTLGAITVFVQSQLSVYVEPIPDFYMFVGSNGFIPVMLMAILLVYVSNGAVPARLLVYSVLGISILTLGILQLYRVYLSVDGAGSLTGLTTDQLVSPLNVRITIGSLIAFIADMFVIAVFYQGVRNYAPKLREEIVIGMALLAALWTDALLFRLVTDFGTSDFVNLLPGDVLGKTLSAFILWVPLAYYLTRIAPKLPGHVGAANRRTFDVLFGSFEEIKLVLVRTEAALAEAEAANREKSEYMQLISDHIEEALWLAGPLQSHAFFVNAAYEKIWGRSAAALYADPKSFLDSIHPEDRERIIQGMPKQAEGNYDVQYRILRPDGTIRWVRDRAFSIYNEQGDVYRIAGITEDITERILLEKQQLELAIERERVKLLRDFIGETSHDLKTPLTSMSLKIELLQRTQDPERRKQHFIDLDRLTERMRRMIDDLLMLARLENLNELQLVKVNINKMIEDICASMRPIIDEKQLEIVLELHNGDMPMYANPQDIERALTNLIENALTYTPQAGMVSVRTESEDEKLIVHVTDTGIGIPETDQSNIFNRFFRASNTSSINGTGLGLAIVKKVVDQHRGQLEVMSVVGTGTTFILHLPKAT